MRDRKALTSPCGLDCFNCDIHQSRLTEQLAELIHTQRGIPREEIACKGCRQQDGKHYHLPSGSCATLDCVKEREVDFCCNCQEFPCSRLAPMADMADRYPHNLKAFNLCRIARVGLDAWIEEEAGKMRKNYFSKKFVMGKGQAE